MGQREEDDEATVADLFGPPRPRRKRATIPLDGIRAAYMMAVRGAAPAPPEDIMQDISNHLATVLVCAAQTIANKRIDNIHQACLAMNPDRVASPAAAICWWSTYFQARADFWAAAVRRLVEAEDAIRAQLPDLPSGYATEAGVMADELAAIGMALRTLDGGARRPSARVLGLLSAHLGEVEVILDHLQDGVEPGDLLAAAVRESDARGALARALLVAGQSRNGGGA